MVESGPIRLGVLASGKGSNFAALADASRRGELGGTVAVLLSDRPDAGALEEARRRSVPAHFVDPGARRTRLCPEAEQRYVETLRDHGVSVVLLAGFMRVLHETFLDAFPMAVLNIHPSLLPEFPGVDAVRRALEAGVPFTGCTVHLVDATVDGGPILAQRRVPILSGDDVESLTARIHEAEHRLFPETVRRFLESPPRIVGGQAVWAEAGANGR